MAEPSDWSLHLEGLNCCLLVLLDVTEEARDEKRVDGSEVEEEALEYLNCL